MFLVVWGNERNMVDTQTMFKSCPKCNELITSTNESAFSFELCGLCEAFDWEDMIDNRSSKEEKTPTPEQKTPTADEEEFNQQILDFKTFITNNPDSDTTLKHFRLNWIANQFVQNTGIPCLVGFPETGKSRLQRMMVDMALGDINVETAENPATKYGDVDEFVEFARQDPRSTVTFKEFKIMKSNHEIQRNLITYVSTENKSE